jgi:flagellar FliL protein
MPTEQVKIGARKIGAGKTDGGPKIGAGKIGEVGARKINPQSSDVPDGAPEADVSKPKGGKKKLLLIIGALAVVAAAALYFFVLAPADSAEVADESPKPVAVFQLEPHSLNLADGHYLRLGFALELAKAVGGGELDAAPALDAAISVFSGRTVAEVTDPQTREELRTELLALVQEYYGADLVLGVKFSDYVTQ